MPNWKKVVTSGSNAHLNDLTLSGDISNTSGNFALDVDGDIELNADGQQITMRDGASTKFTFNLDGTPELDVQGTFTIDGTGDIAVDAAGGNIVFLQNSSTRIDFAVDDTPEMNTFGDFTLDGTADITIDSATKVVDLIGNVTASGNISASGDILTSGDLLKTKFVQMTNSSSVIDTFNTGSFRSAKYVLQVTSGSNYQVSEMLVLHHDNLTASNTEYAQLNSGLNLLDFTTSVSGANVKLSAAGSFLSCSVRYDRTIIPI